jgi:RNA polymerase sigma-70 factor (ECF subfamily)
VSYSSNNKNSNCDLGAPLEQETQPNTGFPPSSEAAVALIEKIKGGDKSSLASLYDGTSHLLLGIIFRVLGDRALAEDTLLDVYTHIWKHAASYHPGFSPLEWLVTTARSCAIARLHWSKYDKKRRELPTGDPDSAMTVAPEQQKFARAAVGSLTPAQKEILDWIYYSGMSCSEIAAHLGKPIGAVKTHARLGLSKLEELSHPLFRQELEAAINAAEGSAT